MWGHIDLTLITCITVGTENRDTVSNCILKYAVLFTKGWYSEPYLGLDFNMEAPFQNLKWRKNWEGHWYISQRYSQDIWMNWRLWMKHSTNKCKMIHFGGKNRVWDAPKSLRETGDEKRILGIEAQRTKAKRSCWISIKYCFFAT